MKKITVYKCEKCGARYNTEEEAQKCEESHGSPVKIVDERYPYYEMQFGYPRYITVQMSNGKLVKYAYAYEKDNLLATNDDSICGVNDCESI